MNIRILPIASVTFVACALWARAVEATQPACTAQEPARPDPELAELRTALAAAREAQAAGEHQLARERIAAAVERAVALLEGVEEVPRMEFCAELGDLAYESGELRAAERAQRALLKALERSLPADHPDLQAARGNLALTIGRLGDLAGARALEEAVLEVQERTLPADHPDLLTARGNLALTIKQLGDLAGARALEEEVLEVLERTLPADHPGLQRARGNLAGTLKQLGDLAGARALEEAALEVLERTLPADHPDLQRTRGNLAVTLHALGDLARARALEGAVLEVRERTLPADHPLLQLARANFAGTIKKLGDLDGARRLEEAVLEVRERTLPADHPDLHTARGNLAATMHALGDLAGARVLQEAVLEARERTLPADHPDLQRARGNLAATMHALGDLAGARVLQEAVLEARERTLPADHPALQTARVNLARTLQDLGEIAGTRALGEAALEALQRRLPADHPDVQAARTSLAVTLEQLGWLADARALHEAVLEVRERTLPADHPYVLAARANLAGTLERLGELADARALQETVLEVRERTLPADHPRLQTARSTLARMIARQAVLGSGGARGEEESSRERERCAELAWESGLAHIRAARLAIRTGSEREAEERCSQSAGVLGMLLSFAQGYGAFEPSDSLLGLAFALSETGRGAGLASARRVRATRGSAEHAQLADELREASRKLTALAQRGASHEEFHAARAARERLERELGRVARDLGAESAWEPEELVQVLAERLREGEALLGLRRYTHSWLELAGQTREENAPRLRDRSVESFGAFVLTRPAEGDEPRLAFVDLGPSRPIEDAVREWRAAIGVGAGEAPPGVRTATAERGVGPSGAPRASALASGQALRRLVWDPIRAALGGAKRVILAPDDVLHLLPFDALPLDEEGELVGDRWRIETRAALWELLDPPPVAASGGRLVALGGAAFDEVAEGLEEHDADAPRMVAAAIGGASLLRGSAWSAGFTSLPNTGPEALEIAALFAEQNPDEQPGLLLERRRASREALEAAAPGARFLHIATHGWFAPESVRSWEDVQAEGQRLWQRASGEETVRGMTPMLLCGLALAGANLAPDSLDRVSGLITAEELSRLDLASCELAVLSACDTNVGERRAGQGVASLQKALHMAGARSVITSLWKVPDEATAELMLDFYRRLWVEKKQKHQALWEGKKRLREARDERGAPRYGTRDWAAWVLTGEPD